ncbi:alpha/beta hydrolase [uncultured Serinicoccus sp.]|uniref:alpha/beta hydrolase family protein n=1 Tax=uncultured Serinicoccus sp. TaxID=735514 RepID=UPI0026246D5C|nr:alpha/beta hydrolase [uncultured Serinicoccus sp.]
MPLAPLLDRRTLLALTGGLSLAACTGGQGSPGAGGRPTGVGTPGAASSPPSAPGPGPATSAQQRTGRISYGDHPSQWAERQVPDGPSRGTVVVLHGGFWRDAYGADLGEPLAADLVARGWSTLNVEYRRVGGGGGYPRTFDDVHAAIELLGGDDEVGESGEDGVGAGDDGGGGGDATAGDERSGDGSADGPVVTLGHSAGGHLAAWAAARLDVGWQGRTGVTHVISQAGVLDLGTAHRERLGSGAARDLVGFGPDDPRFAALDPLQQVPLVAPLWALHAPDDGQVPISQSQGYVAAARAAGATAELVEVAGGHFDHIDVTTDAWAQVVAILDGISPPR